MDDAIREAFEAWCDNEGYTTERGFGRSDNYKFVETRRMWQSWEACYDALQSQTAPAVLQLRELVKRYRDAVENSHRARIQDPRGFGLNAALAAQETVEREIDTLLAAPRCQVAPAVPEGWRLVPSDASLPGVYWPISAGVDAFKKAKTLGCCIDDCLHDALQSMLNSAPQPDHSPDAGKVVQGENRYGLNTGYFRRLIAREFGDLSNFRPDEFARVCARMAATADASVLQEKEFRATPAADGGEVEPAFWITKNDFERASNKTNLLCSVTVRGEWDGLVPLYTHPAESREEIQAGALEEFADSASPNNEAEDVIVRKAYDAAARLRQSGNAGDDGGEV